MKHLITYKLFENKSIIYDLDDFKIKKDKKQIIEDLSLHLIDNGFMLNFEDAMASTDFDIYIYSIVDKKFFAIDGEEEIESDDYEDELDNYNYTGYNFDIIRDHVDFLIKQLNRQLGYYTRGILLFGDDLEGGYEFDEYNEYSDVEDIPENLKIDFIQLEIVGHIPSFDERL